LGKKYSAICGFTLDEFNRYFSEYSLDTLEYGKAEGVIPPEADIEYLKNEIVSLYGGYSWDGETRLLNPFSIIKTFEAKKIAPHWSPEEKLPFPIEFIKNEGYEFSFPRSVIRNRFSLEALELKKVDLSPLLFQTGYLTIYKKLGVKEYLLKRPNNKVSQALDQEFLRHSLGQSKRALALLRERIEKALENFDSASLTAAFRDILFCNSYRDLRPVEGREYELLFSVLNALGFTVATQRNAIGDGVDILISLGKKAAFVSEIKRERFSPKPVADAKGAKDLKYAFDMDRKLKAAITAAKERIQRQSHDEGVYEGLYAEREVVKKMAVAIVGTTEVAVEIY
jgi:hypothetical protein